MGQRASARVPEETLAHAPATRLIDTEGMELLSKREQDVVRWLAEGHTNGEIARKMNISDNTVKNYLFPVSLTSSGYRVEWKS